MRTISLIALLATLAASATATKNNVATGISQVDSVKSRIRAVKKGRKLSQNHRQVQPAVSTSAVAATAVVQRPVSEVRVQAFADLFSAENAALRGALCLLGGAMVHLTLGTLYCWGNFLSYAPTHLRFFDGKDHPGQQPDALYIIPLSIVMQAVMVPIGPLIVDKIGARATTLLGAWLAAGSVFMASFQKTLASFMLFYAFTFGIGIGTAYTGPMIAGWKWLPTMKGLVSGTILGGFGSGGFIFSLLGSKLMNPTKANAVNGKFPDSVYAAFPSSLRKLATMYAAVAFLGTLLVTEPLSPAATSEVAVNAVQKAGNAVQMPTTAVAAVQQVKNVAKTTLPWGMTVAESFKSKQFWLLWLMVITSGTAGLNTASVYKQYAATSTALNGDEFQAFVGGLGALFNGFGRVLWGCLSDILGFKTAYLALTVLQAVSLLTYKYSTGSKASFLLNTSLLFFCLAGNFSLIPSGCQRVFGPKAGGKIYGIAYSGFAVASVAGGVLTKLLVRSAGWEVVFQSLALLSSIAFVLCTLLQPLAGFPLSTV